MRKWTVSYDNGVGPNDEGYWEWWEVTDGETVFKANDESEATWLQRILNKWEENHE